MSLMALPSPPLPSTFKAQGEVCRVNKIHNCFGVKGKGGQLKSSRVWCPKTFDLYCSNRQCYRFYTYTAVLCLMVGLLRNKQK